MREDPESHVVKMAEFMGFPTPSQELREKVLHYSSFEWMAEHDNMFDDHFIEDQLKKTRGGQFGWVSSAKVGLKGDGANTEVNQETKEWLAKRWQDVVTPVTGHETY